MAREFAPGVTRIGWIGTGVMGSSMCGHLMAAGYRATVYNRSRSKAKALIDRGAKEADSPRAVAEASDVTFTIVGYPQDVREVTLGANGTLAGARPDGVLVDMTTSEPALAREIFEAAKAKGVHAIDAPVSGGDIGAREARLSIMIGGEPEIVAALQPLFQAMGKTIVHQGPAGAGQHTKMVNQILIATTMIGICEALLYGSKAGLDLNQVMQSVASGAAGSWSLSNLGTRMIAGNFDPGFFVEHFLKDMAIALAESRRMELALPGLALAEQLYRAVEAQGHGRKGTQALMLALAKMSNIDWKVASPQAGTSDRSPAPGAGGGGTMSHPDPTPPDAPGRPRVLLVEDNDAASKGLARLLEAQGFAVWTAQDGASAARALQAGPPFDFLLTDLSLPDLDGREVARIARGQTTPPYIALITGWDPDPDLGRYAGWGIDLVFAKPLDIHELVTALRQAFGSGSGPRSPSRPGDSGPGAP